MSKSCEFYFDLGSPAAYLAYTQMPGLAARTGATIHYRPLLLGGVFGVPTFFVGDEMFFGQDRLDFVEEALRA